MSRGPHAHHRGLPAPQGLYDPRFEHDACGVGFICHIKGKASHNIVTDALEMLERMNHRMHNKLMVADNRDPLRTAYTVTMPKPPIGSTSRELRMSHTLN